jgi:ABC-type multidrug transport system ATPase subunit
LERATAMIHVENLTKKFGEFVAVDDVSFDVNQGETFALLGPNGSGKSTTLKCLVGLTIPTAGKISINDFDVRKNSREAKRLMSYLPQRVNFHDNLTAREVMQFFCRLRKLPEQRIEQVLNGSNFNFNGFTDKFVNEFSGGMLQRLGLAVACLPDAPIMLLDEPTVGLDPETAIRFREFLLRLKHEGKTIVFTSHVLDDVEQLADRVAILVEGKLVALESIKSLRESLMKSCRMRIVLEKTDKRLIEIVKKSGASDVVIENDSLLVTSHPEGRLNILRAIENAGWHIKSFATEELSLEDVYLKYINDEKK